MRKSLVLFALLSPLVLAACATSKYEKDPMYDAGFSDGCTTGTMRSQGGPPSKPVRDDKDWSASDAYRAGWKSGYGSCAPGSRSDTAGADREPSTH